MTKYCSQCKKIKSDSEFYQSPSKYGGLSAKCRPCSREANKDYERSELGKATVARRTKRMKIKYLHKYIAREKLRTAVRSGKVLKPIICSGCSQQVPLQGHHEDYSKPLEKPLEAEWLCDRCHKLRHNKLVSPELMPLNLKKEQS